MSRSSFVYQSSRHSKRGGSGSRNSRKASKQTIDPARFIKKAEMDTAEVYVPKHEFSDFAIHPLLKSNVAAMGYKAPSEIQDMTILPGLEGRSVVGIANTGTGKTAAFALPILNKLIHQPGSKALIIAPTRELAVQIEEQCKLLAKNSGLRGTLIIGGLPMGRQINDLRRRPDIIIGTPGRIQDHIRQGTLDLSACDMVVLDEVDRMLDMGFIKDVRSILAELPSVHQAFFFSATMSPEIRALIETFAASPVVVNVKIGETSQNVHQDVVTYRGDTKIDSLHEVLLSPQVSKAIVFGKTKYGTEKLSKALNKRGFKTVSLHGGKNQNQRTRALDSFRKGEVNILVATDVAARGIDVKGISHVINYETPATYEDYVHRIGRAGRAAEAGYALTFVEK